MSDFQNKDKTEMGTMTTERSNNQFASVPSQMNGDFDSFLDGK